MKKFIFTFIFILIIQIFIYEKTYSNSSIETRLKNIENEINTYAGESISFEERINNAEIYVFGEKSADKIDNKIIRLEKALGITISQNPTDEIPKYNTNDKELTNYPTIDKLENQIFKKTYNTENIYQRLNRLEEMVFKKISNNSLDERVAKLQNEIIINPKFKQENEDIIFTKQNENYTSELNNKTNDILSNIEEKLWKRNFIEFPNDIRLSKIENKIFGQEFNSDTENQRINRIKTVINASKNKKEYKMNKLAKFAATGLQIGGLVLLILAMLL